MSHQLPFLLFDTPYIIEDETTAFSIDYYHMTPEDTIIIDVFSIRDLRIFAGHLGRFQYCPNCEEGSLQITFQSRPLNMICETVALNKVIYIDPEGVLSYPLALRVTVVRGQNSAFLFEEYLRVYAKRSEWTQERDYFHQWISTYPLIDTRQDGRKDNGLTICLISASFRDFDAVGNFIWDGWSLLKRNGIAVEIYSQYCDPHFRPFTRNIKELLTATADELEKRVLFYTYSIYDENLKSIVALPCKKVAYYHGITDPAQIGDIDDQVKKMCEAGLKELNELSVFDGLFANSQSSLREFRHYCHPDKEECRLYDASTLPPIVAMQSKWDTVIEDSSLLADWTSEGTVLLYVGRMFPHKHVEEVIAVFAEYYKKDNSASLFLVGGQHPSYFAFLQQEIEKLASDCQQRIRFFQTVTQSQLKAIYQKASIFITMTEHEGFCIPVLEAMMFGIPVVAKNTTAIPEVLDGNGILIESFDATSVADNIYRIFHDTNFRERIISGQARRFKEFDDLSLAKKYLGAMQKLILG